MSDPDPHAFLRTALELAIDAAREAEQPDLARALLALARIAEDKALLPLVAAHLQKMRDGSVISASFRN